MATEVQFKIVADAAQAQGATKSIKAELREATNEAKELSRKFGDTSTEAVTAQKKVAALREEISDINQRINALNPEAKFTALGDLAQGVAGGFAAAQGAMALFGAESQDVEKALLKVQSAMAISEGLNSIRGLGDAFGNVKLVVGDAIKSLFTLKGALIATGVGAFAVAVGTIVANWKELSGWIDKTFPQLGGIANIFDNIKKAAMGSLNVFIEYFKSLGEMMKQLFTGEWGNLVETAKNLGSRLSKAYTEGYLEEEKKQANEREIALLESQQKTHQRQLKLLEAQGKDTYAFKKKLLEDELRLIELQKTKESDEYKDKFLEIQILETEHYKALEQIRLEAARKEAEEKEKMRLRALEVGISLKESERKAEEEERKARGDAFDIMFAEQTEQNVKEQKLDEEQRKKKEEEDKKALADKQTIEQAKLQIAQQGLNGIVALGNLLISNDKKLRKFQKAAAITQIAIDTATAISTTIRSATAAAAAGGPAAPFLQATYIATGIATVLANILKAKQLLSGAGEGGGDITLPSAAGVGGGFSGGIGQASAPVNAFQRSTAGGSITNQEGEGANALNQIKVFVTENDISSTQQRVQSIRKKATLVQ